MPYICAGSISSTRNLLAIHAYKVNVSFCIQLKYYFLWEAWLPLRGCPLLYILKGLCPHLFGSMFHRVYRLHMYSYNPNKTKAFMWPRLSMELHLKNHM